ncbi:TPA: DUF4116 domain-containing protein [Clostridioides difficile]|nr:DUF4116 domain-containing protein [Clostridioides difficile]
MKEVSLDEIKKFPWKIKEYALYYVEEQSDEICMEEVRRNGLVLFYVKKQTEEICIEAVKENGYALKYVEKQTPKICIEAVKENGCALKYVKWNELEGKLLKDQTEEICIEALKQNKLAIIYIKDKNKYLEELNIKYLEAQGEAREVISIEKNGEWLFTVGCQRNITKEEFIHRIYNTNGGFDLENGINVHRQIYLDFLEKF